MEYRDQVKYIKSHGETPKPAGKRKRKTQKKKNGRTEYNSSRKKRKNSAKKGSYGREKDLKKARNGSNTHIQILLWRLQLFATFFAMAAFAILGIFPLPFFVAAAVIFFLFLLYVKHLHRRSRIGEKRRNSGAGVSLVLSVVLIILGFYSFRVNAALDQIAVGEESGGYQEAHSLPVLGQSFNIYISGIDVYGDINQESRSDVNLIATVNPNTHRILLTTTPRDYYVYIPGVSGDERDKLTHAGTYGIDTSIAALENLYDTDIPFYIRVNFTSVEEIVDVMGGINVESEYAFTTSKAAGEIVDVKKGINHFNGKQALAFVRERKALASGDNQRGKNQQALLSALIKKAVSPMIVFRANRMISSVAGNAQTNLSEDQIKALVRMQIGSMEGWEIESVAAEGDDSGKRYCYSYDGGPLYVTVPYESSVEKIRDKIRQIKEK